MTEAPKSTGHTALRSEVSDLFEPVPLIYWADFGAHAVLGWTAFGLAVTQDGPFTWLFVLLAAGALYRAVIFTHELVHVRRGKLPGFRIVWDAVCGIPVLAPSFLYDGVHQEHHFRHQYGTPEDGEYLPFGHSPRRSIAIYMAGHVVIPALAILRFGLVAPVSWAWPALRRMALKRMSSLSIDPRYVRKLPPAVPAAWRVQEAGCTALVWAVGAGLWAGWLPVKVLWVWYVVAAAVLLLNGVRTLAAHRYDNREGTLTREEQLLDSVNIAGSSPLTPVLAPVGLRYHALHHLFPTMPYHHLGEAHRRLMRVLPGDAPYRATVENGFLPVLVDLWRRAGRIGNPAAGNESGAAPDARIH